jgi:hypothetical protein
MELPEAITINRRSSAIIHGKAKKKQIERLVIFRIRISPSTVSHTKTELLQTPTILWYVLIQGLKGK